MTENNDFDVNKLAKELNNTRRNLINIELLTNNMYYYYLDSIYDKKNKAKFNKYFNQFIKNNNKIMKIYNESYDAIENMLEILDNN